MVAEIIFHVGDCKTGSTMLQSSLRAGIATADGQRIHMMEPGLAGSLHQSLLPRGPDEARARDVLRQIRRRIGKAGRDARHVVISDERLELSPPDLFARLVEEEIARPLKGTRIRVVNYIRPHAERLLASFAEQSKMGWATEGIEEFRQRWARARRIDYAPRLQKWRVAFGERFEIRPFLRDADRSWDVVSDFLSVLDPGAEWRLPPAQDAEGNVSLGLADLVRLRHLHGRLAETVGRLYPLPLRAHHRLGWELARHFARHPATGQPRLVLHRAVAERIAGHWAADAAALDATWFAGTADGRFFRDRLERAVSLAADQPSDLSPQSHFTPSELRSLDLWADVMAAAMTADPEGFLAAIRPPKAG